MAASIIESVSFNDGTLFCPGEISVFVGPNNSGKSKALDEIVAFSTNRRNRASSIIVKELSLEGPRNWSELVEALPDSPALNEKGHSVSTENCTLEEGHNVSHQPGVSTIQEAEGLINQRLSEETKRQESLREFMEGGIAFLKTDRRLNLLDDCETPKNIRSPRNFLHNLYRGGS